jgi:hypothetical protein
MEVREHPASIPAASKASDAAHIPRVFKFNILSSNMRGISRFGTKPDLALQVHSKYIMRTNWLLFLVLPWGLAAQAADVCDPAHLIGPYAFQLTGSTDIAGTPQPTVSLGRLAFDGRGNLSGTASATFNGLLLGNPVTGSYEAKPDCSVRWKLQDDSGAFQNFGGTFSTDGTRVQFRQTDPGGAQRGMMQKTSDTCSEADLLKEYDFTVSGSSIPMQAGEVAQTLSAKGKLDVAENGSFQVESDCSVRFEWILPAEDGQDAEPSLMAKRGFLVDGGKEILAFQTDPGAMVAARFTSGGK